LSRIADKTPVNQMISRAARLGCRASVRAGGRPPREDVGGLEHADQRHHGEQQQDDVEVDGLLAASNEISLKGVK
jgi:hypothetical protein